jgi:hypothetical protein
VAELHYKGVVGVYGEEPWEWAGSIAPASRRRGHANIYATDDDTPAKNSAGIFHDALDQADPEKEKAFVASISSGKFHNQAALGAEITLSTLLGRQAAYSGTGLTWDELLASNQTYDAELEAIDLREFE